MDGKRGVWEQELVGVLRKHFIINGKSFLPKCIKRQIIIFALLA